MSVAFSDVDLKTLSPSDFFSQLMSSIVSPEGEAAASSMTPLPTDVLTITTPKTGQTWLLAVLRRLSLGKDADVTGKNAVSNSDSPDSIVWMESKAGHKRLDSPQPGSFRIFKSHLTCSQSLDLIKSNPKTRFITTLRDPHDVANSLYRHLRSMYSKAYCGGDTSTFDAAYPSADSFASVDLGYEDNVVQWLNLRGRDNVMVLFYEDMVSDVEGFIRRVGDFVGVHVTDELMDKVKGDTDYNGMAANPEFTNIVPGGGTYGKGAKALEAATVEVINKRFKDVTGYESYRDLYTKITGKTFPF